MTTMKVEQSSLFVRQFKKYKRMNYDTDKLLRVVQLLVASDGQTLVSKYRDHALTGEWRGYRELHLEKDWLLIYQIVNSRLVLLLVATGSHDSLFKK